ncbi:MAG: preprotein translocase subunit YajC [Polyangiales bacterium]
MSAATSSAQTVTTVLLLPEASKPAPDGGSGGGPGLGGPGCATNAGLIAVMLLVLYFVSIRPQQKQQKEHQSMLSSLKRGSIVRTRGGLRGEVVDVGERDITLMIADRVKVQVLRSHIAGLDAPEPAAAGKS